MRVAVSLALGAMMTRFSSQHRVQAIASAVMVMQVLGAASLLAPPAVADTADNLRSAVAKVRSASCGPLRSDPMLDKVAGLVNRSTDVWLDQRGRFIPVDDPLPLMKDLGYQGKKVKELLGANVNDAKSIKGLLLEGYLDIPDCAYTMYGVNVMQNRTTDYILTVVVLAA